MRLQILKGIAIGAAGILTVATTASYAQDQNQQDWNACAGAAAAARDRVEACTRILGRDIPQMQAFALIHRGRAWVRKGDFDRALADFTTAIKEDADIVYGYADRGDVYRLRGQCEEAIADYDYALRLAPDRADIYLSRGICQTEQRRSDSAAINFDMAVRLDPSNAAGVAALALTRKADIAAMKGDFARAAGLRSGHRPAARGPRTLRESRDRPLLFRRLPRRGGRPHPRRCGAAKSIRRAVAASLTRALGDQTEFGRACARRAAARTGGLALPDHRAVPRRARAGIRSGGGIEPCTAMRSALLRRTMAARARRAGSRRAGVPTSRRCLQRRGRRISRRARRTEAAQAIGVT